MREALDAGPITVQDLPTPLRDHWVNAQGQARILVRPASTIADNADLEAFADAVLAAAPEATGTPVVVVEAGRAVVGASGRPADRFDPVTTPLVLELQSPRIAPCAR